MHSRWVETQMNSAHSYHTDEGWSIFYLPFRWFCFSDRIVCFQDALFSLYRLWAAVGLVQIFLVESRDFMSVLKMTHSNPIAFVISVSRYWKVFGNVSLYRTSDFSISSLAPVLQGIVSLSLNCSWILGHFSFIAFLTLSTVVFNNKFRSFISWPPLNTLKLVDSQAMTSSLGPDHNASTDRGFIFSFHPTVHLKTHFNENPVFNMFLWHLLYLNCNSKYFFVRILVNQEQTKTSSLKKFVCET